MKRIIDRSFVHLPGIGQKLERKIWDFGIYDWESCRDAVIAGDLHPTRETEVLEMIDRSIQERDNPHFFEEHLPRAEHWRLFPELFHSVGYLDIETDGRHNNDSMTAASIYDGIHIHTYVRGENLTDLKDDLRNYQLLVTFNGKSFDIPMIEKNLGIKLNNIHIDLMHLFRSMDVTGGLKKIEAQFGVDRGALVGVDGYYAVLLWRYFRNMDDPRALETLLAYNVEDVIHLERLMIIAYNMKLERLGYFKDLAFPDISDHRLPANPFRIHSDILNLVRQYLAGKWYR